jgi:hypothetical protein
MARRAPRHRRVTGQTLPRPFFWLWRILQALADRAELVNEVLRLKSAGRPFPPGILAMILRAPHRYDDFIHMFCFLDPRNTTTLIDVGANIGDFTADFLKFFPKAEVFAFEPTSEPSARLRSRLESDARVRVFNCALDHEEGSREINIAERATHSSFFTYLEHANERRN